MTLCSWFDCRCWGDSRDYGSPASLLVNLPKGRRRNSGSGTSGVLPGWPGGNSPYRRRGLFSNAGLRSCFSFGWKAPIMGLPAFRYCCNRGAPGDGALIQTLYTPSSGRCRQCFGYWQWRHRTAGIARQASPAALLLCRPPTLCPFQWQRRQRTSGVSAPK